MIFTPPYNITSKLLFASLVRDLRVLIEGSRARVAVSVNRELVLLYWEIGTRIHTEILGQERADYGRRIIPDLVDQLSAEFGQGFQKRNLYRMVQFAQAFPDREKVSTLLTHLIWRHFLHLLLIKDPLAQDKDGKGRGLGMEVLKRWAAMFLRQRGRERLLNISFILPYVWEQATELYRLASIWALQGSSLWGCLTTRLKSMTKR